MTVALKRKAPGRTMCDNPLYTTSRVEIFPVSAGCLIAGLIMVLSSIDVVSSRMVGYW